MWGIKATRRDNNTIDYIIYTPSGMWCPKTHSSSTGDGALKMYCLVAHFRLYADVTLKLGKLGTLSLHPKGLRGENSLKERR
jgi:hypothetical protein